MLTDPRPRPPFATRRARPSPSRRKPAPRLWLEPLEERCVLSADVVMEWNALAIEAVRLDHGLGAPHLQGGPARASRALAIVQAAVYDAVNTIDGSYTPYLYTGTAAANASMDAAVATAAHDTLVALYPQQSVFFDSHWAKSLIAIPPAGWNNGIELG